MPWAGGRAPRRESGDIVGHQTVHGPIHNLAQYLARGVLHLRQKDIIYRQPSRHSDRLDREALQLQLSLPSSASHRLGASGQTAYASGRRPCTREELLVPAEGCWPRAWFGTWNTLVDLKKTVERLQKVDSARQSPLQLRHLERGGDLVGEPGRTCLTGRSYSRSRSPHPGLAPLLNGAPGIGPRRGVV